MELTNDIAYLEYTLLIAIGIIAGFLNVVAGGGSLITLPILIWMGFPSAVANGTNRVGIFFQNIFAVKGFIQEGHRPDAYGLYMSISSIIGSLVGASIAVDIDDKIFNKLLAVVMVVIIVKTVVESYRNKKGGTSQELLSKGRKAIGILGFFFVGMYGGFIQAGVGFIIIAVLSSVNHFSLVKINSYKVFIALIYTMAALVIFIWNDKVNYTAGIILAIGTSLGGWLGAKFSSLKGDKWIRIFLLIAVSVLAVKLFFFSN